VKIVLASKSPRRKTLLEEMGYLVDVDVSNFDEDSVEHANAVDLVMEIAKQKGLTVKERHADSIIVTADTMVFSNGEPIGQQKTDQEAIAILKQLCGHTHEVITGVCIINTSNNKMIQGSDSSEVTLKQMSDEKIQEYVKSGLYKGKAGSYNIADPEFESFIEEVKGDYPNIMGLPKKVKGMIEKVK